MSSGGLLLSPGLGAAGAERKCPWVAVLAVSLSIPLVKVQVCRVQCK